MDGSQENAIELEGVTRTFRNGLLLRRAEVLRGVDLALARGRTLGLVGPNGSGKTTLLRLVAGVDAPTAGRVRVLGGSPHEAGVRARIGYLPEDSPFPPELTARGGLELLASLRRVPRAERRARADALLSEVGLAAHANKRLGRFSRGMLRRFGLAQAWLCEPDLVLLDEPTAGLDAPGFEVLARLLARARERNTSVVIASHLASDLTRHADEMVVLLDGRVARRGTPGELLGEGADARDLGDLYRAAARQHGGA